MSGGIPADLAWFSAIYEYRVWILLPVLLAGLGFGGYALFKGKRIYFFYAVFFPVLLSAAAIGCVWCGWHYRMELRDRYAVENRDEININRMPPEIYREYAKHDFQPRFRDLKAMAVTMIVGLPLLFGLLALLWRLRRRRLSRG